MVILSFCLLGCFGNAISIWVFTRKSMRSPINILLCAMSFIDLCLLLLAQPVIVVAMLIFEHHIPLSEQGEEMFFFFSIRVFFPLMMSAQTASNWIFIVISFERFIAVCRPFLKVQYATRKHAVWSVIAVILLAFSYNAVRFWEYTSKTNGTYFQLESYLRGNRPYFYVYYTGLYLLTHFLIPSVTLLIVNFDIIKNLRQDKLLLGEFMLIFLHISRFRKNFTIQYHI